MNKNNSLYKIKEVANRIVQILRANGFEAYWVGGCVRDMLLGIEPQDIDIATNAPPEKIVNLFEKTITVGAKFGVVIVMTDSVQIEVATFRSDGVYLDSRHPVEVHFSTAQADAERRDFTINAMFYDPSEDKVIDFVNGRNDLKNHIIRGIGKPKHRFEEDALRMLRAIRFSIRFDFKIEENTWNALCELSNKINNISADRVREELIKIFTGPRAGESLRVLSECGLLKEVLPEIESMKGVNQPPNFHPEGDVFEHTVLAMNLLKNPSLTLAFGTLLHDVGKPITYEVDDRIRFNKHDKVGADVANLICKRLNFSNADRKKIAELIDRHMVFLNITDMKTSRLKRFFSHENFAEDFELHRVDCLASHKNLENYYFCKQKMEEFANEPIIPTPLINGKDLQELGYKPGPLFKEILNKSLDAQLEGKLSTREDAVEFVKQNFPIEK